jgi:hypothetical protein
VRELYDKIKMGIDDVQYKQEKIKRKDHEGDNVSAKRGSLACVHAAAHGSQVAGVVRMHIHTLQVYQLTVAGAGSKRQPRWFCGSHEGALSSCACTCCACCRMCGWLR